MVGRSFGLKTGDGASDFNLNPNIGFFAAYEGRDEMTDDR